MSTSKRRAVRWERFGQRLREARLRQKLSGKAAGAVLNVSAAAWWKIEQGISVPNAWQVRTLCLAWGLDADDLLAMGQEEEMVASSPKVPGGRARKGTPSSSSRKTNSTRDRTTT